MARLEVQVVSLGVGCISVVSARSGREVLDVHSLLLDDVGFFVRDISVHEFAISFPDQS